MEKVELKTTEPGTQGAELETKAQAVAGASEANDEASGPSAKEVVAYLVKTYPACFAEEGSGNAKPLKVGIFNDIVERTNWEEVGFSKTKLRIAIRYYTNSWDYLACVVAGSKRVDLDGAEVDEVSAQHADYAKERLEASKAKFEAAKAARNAAKQAARAARNAKNGNKDGEGRTRGPRRQGGKFEGRNQNGKRPARVGDRRPNGNRPAKPQVREEVAFEQLDANDVKVGLKVHVMIGSSPVAATVKEVVRSVVAVEFDTGMVARVAIDRIGK